jgi:very-short-patch-repair endonuclease
MNHKCITCGKEFTNQHRRKYCSQKCYWKNLSILRTGTNNNYYGLKHSDETKTKMRQNARKTKSEEHKKKIGEANSRRIIKDSTRKKRSDIMINRFVNGYTPYYKGKHMTQESKNKISESHKKMYQSEKGIKLREDLRTGAINRLKTNKRFSNTKPEIIIKEYLMSQGLVEDKDFVRQYYVKNIKNRFAADFYIPKTNTIIESDGDYFHAKQELLDKYNKEMTPRQLKQYNNDYERTIQMHEAGYKVLRFWESQIKKEFDEVQKIIIEVI